MENRNRELLGLLAGVVGIMLFSSKAVIIKLAYDYHVPPVTLLLWRMLIALPFFLAVLVYQVRRQRDVLPENGKAWGFLLFLGVIGYYVASLLDFTGLQYISASLERLILFVYPTMVVMISAAVLKTVITRKMIIAILITYAGVVLIFIPDGEMQLTMDIWIGAGFIFSSALVYAYYLVGSQQAMVHISPGLFTSIAMIIACGAVVSHQFLLTGTIPALPDEVLFYAALMAIVATVIPSYLISFAIKRVGASEFSILGSLGPVSTIVLSMIFLDEILTFYQVIGGLVIIGGVVWVSLAKKRLEK